MLQNLFWKALNFCGACLSLGNNLLKKKILEAGQGRDSRPQKGQNVKIHLKTHLMDGTLVEEQPDLSFTMGDGDVIQVKNRFVGFGLFLSKDVYSCVTFLIQVLSNFPIKQ